MHQRKTRRLLKYRLFAQSILVLCAAAASLSAQAVPLLPNIRYWPDVPTPRGGLGFDIGMRHLQHHELVKYMHAVADASPRVKLQEYARTHGGKPLLLLTITSPANHRQLDRIRKQHRRLTDSSRSGEVDIESLPVVINMGYGVHGNEPSGTNCAPLVVYYLAAALDRQVEKLLEDCVMLVDPCLNPDGFERFASWSNNHRGRHPNPDPSDREHDEPWPSGRTNYYWFDLNRDWLPLEHPESRGRMQWYHQWKPNVVLDFHEMGSGATYFFQPGIPSRGNPLIPNSNVQLTRQIAKFHAKAFDKIGELYYTEESFDDFYLGKGSSYPDVHGAVGILFEQASSRGMVQKTKHGTRRFSDTVRNQLTTSLSSLEAVQQLRVKLNSHKREFYRESRRLAEIGDVSAFVVSSDDAYRLQAFKETLSRHDIHSHWKDEDRELATSRIRVTKSLVIPTEQPEYRFLMGLMQQHETFRDNTFYDVSAWTLPLAYGLDMTTVIRPDKDRGKRSHTQVPDVASDPVVENAPIYVFDWQDYLAPKTAYRLMKAKVPVYFCREPFVIDSCQGQRLSFSAGSFFVQLKNNSKHRQRILSAVREAEDNGVRVAATATAATPDGPDLGSSVFEPLSVPEVALLIGGGVSAYEAGEVWHLLDRKFDMHVTKLEYEQLTKTDLDRFSTLILVGGSYEFSSAAGTAIGDFVRQGGTLISYAKAAAALENAKLFDEIAETASFSHEDENPLENRRPYEDASRRADLERTAGAILEVDVDITHPLGFGLPKTLPVFRNHNVLLTPSTNVHANPLVYTEKIVLSGYVSQNNRKLIANSASVVVRPLGSGRVILLAENPAFRAYWYGTNRLLLNGIFLSDLISNSLQ